MLNIRSAIIALFLLCPAARLVAQVHDSLNYTGQYEIAISVGLLSLDQWRGIAHDRAVGRKYSDLVDMPKMYTSAAFISGYYCVSNRLAVGAAIGLDNQRGRLSYGGPHSSYAMEMGNSGKYNREFYSIAAECRYTYERWFWGMVYCAVGAGITTGHVNYTIYPDAKYSFHKHYGSASANITHFNAQVTPFGIRGGKKLAVFFELGFGYKGMFVGGMSYHI